ADELSRMIEEGLSELRLAAIIVYHHWHSEEMSMTVREATEATAAEHRRRIEVFRIELKRIIRGRDDISFRINGGCVEAEVEDLRFASLELTPSEKQEPVSLVTLLGRCPHCGTETISEPIYNLAGLGEML